MRDYFLTWQERQELCAARGEEFRRRQNMVTEAVFRAYLKSHGYYGSEIDDLVREYRPSPRPFSYEERRTEASIIWLKDYLDRRKK